MEVFLFLRFRQKLTLLSTILLSTTIFLVSSCQEKQMPNDPSLAFAMVKSYYDDKDYEIALQKLDEFKARFPYSSFVTQAELLIAESEFKLHKYDEAALSYSNFVKLHPNNPNVPYALHQTGLCFWKLTPSTIDREQSYTYKAISSWEELTSKYPDSEYSKKDSSLLDEARRKVVDHLEFITNFYYERDQYSPCAYRSLELIEKAKAFPDILKVAIPRAIVSFEKVLEEKQKNPDDDKTMYLTMSEDQIQTIIDKLREYDLNYNNKSVKNLDIDKE